MTREEALNLLSEYQEEFKKNRNVLFHHSSDDNNVLTCLYDRFPENGNKDKAMRWLGFAQGASWVLGFFDLEELKNHIKEKKI